MVWMVLQLISTAAFIVGFSAPYWNGEAGLWMSCDSNSGVCANNLVQASVMVHIARCLLILALIFIVLSMAVGMYKEVIATRQSHKNGLLEFLGVMGGMMGLTGAAMYGVTSHFEVTNFKVDSDPSFKSDSANEVQHLSWGFGLAITGIALYLLATLMVIANRAEHAMGAIQFEADLEVSDSCTTLNANPMQPGTLNQTDTVIMAPAHGSHESQVPSCFLMVHDQRVPVSEDVAATITTTSTAGSTRHEEGSGDALPSECL